VKGWFARGGKVVHRRKDERIRTTRGQGENDARVGTEKGKREKRKGQI